MDGSSCGRGIEVGVSVLMGSRKRSVEKSLPDYELWELLGGDFVVSRPGWPPGHCNTSLDSVGISR